MAVEGEKGFEKSVGPVNGPVGAGFAMGWNG